MATREQIQAQISQLRMTGALKTPAGQAQLAELNQQMQTAGTGEFGLAPQQTATSASIDSPEYLTPDASAPASIVDGPATQHQQQFTQSILSDPNEPLSETNRPQISSPKDWQGLTPEAKALEERSSTDPLVRSTRQGQDALEMGLSATREEFSPEFGAELEGLINQGTQQASGFLSEAQQRSQDLLGGFAGGGNQAFSALLQDTLGGDTSFVDRQRERQAEGINRQLAARGLTGSGAGLELLNQADQDMLLQDTENRRNRMQGLAGLGMEAGGSLAGLQSNLLGAQAGLQSQNFQDIVQNRLGLANQRAITETEFGQNLANLKIGQGANITQLGIANQAASQAAKSARIGAFSDIAGSVAGMFKIG